ncbi:metallophosphoesterase family protein [Paenibacillus sp. GCM10023252]|uniref:metallophosphoesterase family protein n=1 Tax=Paenibacillus sp. GCM10023252 TaxID=3252649 RepID=UPI00361CD81C
MKSYAIITDVHGNGPALEAVLKDIRRRKVDYIYCLGDMIGIGPDSNEVMEQLLEQSNISCIIGNHELAILAAYQNKLPPLGNHNERIHHKWLADRIDEKYISFLNELPMSLVHEDSGRKLYFTHYHLDSSNYFIPIDKDPTKDKLDELYMNTEFDIVCFGHHHIVHQFQTKNRIYFNPGSLGCYNKPIARYGIVKIIDLEILTELVEVPYNNLYFLRSYEELKVPERELLLKVFHGAQIF